MRYQYQALDNQSQTISGVLTANSSRDATRQLQKRGLTTLSLKLLEADTRQRRVTTPKARDVLMVLHELTTLLESGIALIDAVEALAASSHPIAITEAFSDIASKLRRGMAFSVALQESPLKLPWYIQQLVAAGELTGHVATALRDGVEQMEYDNRVATELRNAMIYPSILIFSGITAVILIFTLVVPRFANILQNRGGDIPFLAKAVLTTGMVLNTHFWWFAGGLVLIGTLLFYTFSQAQVRRNLYDSLARLPLIGTWLLEAETARWAAMMGTLLSNRVAVLQALDLALQGVQLPSLQARLSQVSKAVRAGTSLSQALQDNDALNATGHNLIRAGEKAGELPKMLRSLASLLSESGRTRMKRVLLLVEPLSILIIGAVIGVIITGVILAITSVNEIQF